MSDDHQSPSGPPASLSAAAHIRPPGSVKPFKPEPKPIPVWVIVLLGTMIGTVMVMFGTRGQKHYGVGVFVVLPAIIGWSVATVYNVRRAWDWRKTVAVVALVFVCIGVALMMGLAEGMFCILLAGILATPFILLGICIAVMMKERRQSRSLGASPKMHSFVLLLLPTTMALESSIKLEPPVIEQTTSIEVNAPPEVVWRFIPSFPRIESPPTKMLAMGIAYPMAAEMDGAGVGASRRCVLSTGAMPEVVTVWEPGKQMEFDVLETPPAMEETNPFGRVEAPHTEGYFVCKHGRFVLHALPGGRTRVEGTSWFQHDLWPQAYWAPLTREVVHEVHERVLQHIKSLAEAVK